MKNKLTIVLLMSLLASSCAVTPRNHWQIVSPNNQLAVQIMIDHNGGLFYILNNQGRSIIGESPLGINFEEASFDDSLTLVSHTDAYGLNELYTLLTGKQLENYAIWNEMTLTFRNRDENIMRLIVRMYDEGLAFRYSFEGAENTSYTLKEELTGFQIPAQSYGWMHPYDSITQYAPAYETYYENKLEVGTPSPAGKNGWAFPMLFHTGEDWLLISDADMMEGYTGMYVDGTPENGLYTLILPKEEEAMGVCTSQPVLSLPFMTPWRFVATGTGPGAIVESNLVFHLSTPNVLEDTSWIQPGRSAWSWWSESDSPRDYRRMSQFIDFTAQMGWEYFLVDANWNEMVDGDLKMLTAYAASRGVGITAWYNSGGPHNVVTEQPRNLMHERETRRAEMEKLRDWGVKGIKVDFFQSDKYCILQQYHDILQDAADFQLLVNVHGATIPRGWQRTYPHLVSMESVMGSEVYKFGRTFPDRAPVHNTILPFTRNVIGSMDYTPVAFSNSTYPKLTTHGHELALAVVFESGIQHFADSDNSYLSQPPYVLEYLSVVPATWDETRFIDGYPGEMVIIARRKGETWYVSGISALTENRSVETTLSFLDPGDYTMSLITDGVASGEFTINKTEVKQGDSVTFDFLPRGGFAAVITRQ